MLGFLSDCSLPTQNRLLDHDTKNLSSMSISELNALCLVAEIGFLKGYAYQQAQKSAANIPSDKCRSAISVVCSCATLIANLWFIPRFFRDGNNAVAFIHEDHRIFVFQVYSVFNFCPFGPRVGNLHNVRHRVFKTENPRTSRSDKIKLTRAHAQCLLAIRTVDKPNVHRLIELAHCTLPMMGHISRFGELVLEKRHEALKRAVKQSNNKDAQIQAMKDIALSD